MTHSATASRSADRAADVPRVVSLLSPLLKPILEAGMPLGPNALVTIRGRTSGEPRTTPLAIIDAGGRRWVWSPWGDVHWVRNLRAAGEATVTVRRRTDHVTATELDEAERAAFFRDVLTPYARSMRGGMAFVRIVDQVDLGDPVAVARDRRVFELHPRPEA
jgi:deazaflavin-dependent oxidoreductase (nitroreductase family)